MLAAVLTILARAAVNAEKLGAHDFGLALFLSTWGGVGLVLLTRGAPILAIAGVATLFFEKKSGLRFIAAGLVSLIPLAVFSWFW